MQFPGLVRIEIIVFSLFHIHLTLLVQIVINIGNLVVWPLVERPEVAIGIIRVLTKLLRERVRDISHLDSRIKELEDASKGKV